MQGGEPLEWTGTETVHASTVVPYKHRIALDSSGSHNAHRYLSRSIIRRNASIFHDVCGLWKARLWSEHL